jgi:Transcriptional regulatory protein, C terminal
MHCAAARSSAARLPPAACPPLLAPARLGTVAGAPPLLHPAPSTPSRASVITAGPRAVKILIVVLPDLPAAGRPAGPPPCRWRAPACQAEVYSAPDDYLPKPFAFTELVARVRALSRRAPSTPPVVTRGDLTVDRARRRVSRGGRLVPLTRKEFGVLEAVLGADGAVISTEELLENVWDEHADPFSNTVSVTMARLRRKLGEPSLIETVIGSGYRLRVP